MSAEPNSPDMNRRPTTAPSAPTIPDHELIRIIGRGAYGEVWLARNLMGTWRAIKVVRRQDFDNERPFEREFHGIRKFEPVSRTHEGMVDILQVGVSPDGRLFYCVMELADDIASQAVVPETYSPRSLRSELRRRGRLGTEECLRLAVSIADALRHLHDKGLVHRDIKPSNVIFVNGTPKLADIGLVTDSGGANTFVGTEGFIPPEGPGTPQADIFAFGKLLYEISTGKDRLAFPEPVPDLGSNSNPKEWRELNAIVLRACEPNLAQRYASANSLLADLALLQSGKSVRRLRALEHRVRWISRASALLAILALGAGIAGWAQSRQRDAIARLNVRLNEALGRLEIQRAEDFFQMENAELGLACLAGALRKHPADAAVAQRLMSALTEHLVGTPPMTTIRHSNYVIVARFDGEGSRVLTASTDGTARVWDADTGEPRTPPLEHSGILAAEFSPDGRWVATAGEDRAARVWNSITGAAAFHALVHSGSVDRIVFSPDGNLLATAPRSGGYYLWDVDTGRSVWFLHSPGTALDVTFSSSGEFIGTAGGDGSARIWRTSPTEPVSPILQHAGRVGALAFSPDGGVLATGSSDSTARLWQVPDGQPLATLSHTAEAGVWPSFGAGEPRILTPRR